MGQATVGPGAGADGRSRIIWRYIAAALLFLIGAIEIILALNGRLREEILKNSPIPLPGAAPFYLFFAGLSALVMALGIILYSRFF